MIIKSLEQLNFLSVEIAKKLSKSDSILLFGEIGVGKTTFTRNLINFFQEQDNVQITDVLSPTFNLLYEYEFKDFKIMHYDLYRLKNSKEIQQIGIFEETKAVIKIIEWPELIKNRIPNRIEINLSYAENENERNFEMETFGKCRF
jgi:tRNA threonylcarbamoyl adenosine modification protein YjeE|tara:strand:- start:137 stop:574 length:438 start_codon:yes stop_codon:yes gene_type:complete